MLQVEEQNPAKINRYIDLLLDQEKLVRSSRSIIRKKHSPLARKIANGNVQAIMRAAKDRIFGSLSREQRLNLCKILCDLKSKLKGSAIERWREFIALTISGTVAFINQACGLLIELLWVIRQEVQNAICSCKLSGACQSGAC
jgi:hypothetical protein